MMMAVDVTGLSRLQQALVTAAEGLRGGGSEEAVRAAAVRITGDTGPYGADAHYAKAFRQLEERGIFRAGFESHRSWWLTDEAWQALGHEGVVRPPQEGLF